MRKLLFGAALVMSAPAINAQVTAPMEDVNKVVDLTLDSLGKAETARVPAGSSRKGDNPVLFLVGNSTMRNGTLGNGNNGQWGWGFYAHAFFDENRITVENQALGGTSSRTFYNRLWPDVRKGLRKGDWVIISIGHNDNGPYDSGRARASIPGIGNDSLPVTIKETGVKETVYTYGEYLRRYINDCKAVGANAILMSLTPRDAYDDNGKIVRVDKTFGLWARQVAQQENVPFVDLNERSAAKLDSYGPWKEKYHFYTDHIHTSRFGAMMNARSAAEGIAESDDPKLAALKAMMVNVALPTVDVEREEGKPVVFITGDSTVVVENPYAAGPAWMARELTYVKNADAEMAALGTIDPTAVAVADERFRAALGDNVPSVVPGDTVVMTGYTPNTLTYDVTTKNGGVCVFSEVWFPWGWKATIDGKPAQLGRVNYVLRALRVPAGSHKVSMTFDPDSIHNTTAAAYICVTLIYLLLLAALFRVYLGETTPRQWLRTHFKRS